MWRGRCRAHRLRGNRNGGQERRVRLRWRGNTPAPRNSSPSWTLDPIRRAYLLCNRSGRARSDELLEGRPVLQWVPSRVLEVDIGKQVTDLLFSTIERLDCHSSGYSLASANSAWRIAHCRLGWNSVRIGRGPLGRWPPMTVSQDILT